MRYKLLSVIFCMFFSAQRVGQMPRKSRRRRTAGGSSQSGGDPNIGFYLGATSNSYGFWTVWNPGDPVEFDVSANIATVPPSTSWPDGHGPNAGSA